jgi:hypothetical protein
MHRLEFSSFAQVIDPQIETICEFAPPDQRKDGLMCRWKFKMK